MNLYKLITDLIKSTLRVLEEIIVDSVHNDNTLSFGVNRYGILPRSVRKFKYVRKARDYIRVALEESS